MNAEIVDRLARSFDPPLLPSQIPPEATVSVGELWAVLVELLDKQRGQSGD